MPLSATNIQEFQKQIKEKYPKQYKEIMDIFNIFDPKQAILDEWIKQNRRHWKDELEFFKKCLTEIIAKIEMYNLGINDPLFLEESLEIQHKMKTNLADGLIAKKVYSRHIKFLSYCYNNDYKNLIKYHNKTKESMEELMEFYMENKKEGKMIEICNICKTKYEEQKAIVVEFKLAR